MSMPERPAPALIRPGLVNRAASLGIPEYAIAFAGFQKTEPGTDESQKPAAELVDAHREPLSKSLHFRQTHPDMPGRSRATVPATGTFERQSFNVPFRTFHDLRIAHHRAPNTTESRQVFMTTKFAAV